MRERKKTSRDTAEIPRSAVRQAICELLTLREDRKQKSRGHDKKVQAVAALRKLRESKRGGRVLAEKLGA